MNLCVGKGCVDVGRGCIAMMTGDVTCDKARKTLAE